MLAWRPERLPRLVLAAVAAVACAAYAAAAVPRLTDYNAGDMDLAGFTGFVAARFTAGERPYLDFLTPLGPGSLLVQSAMERLSRSLRLIDELWLIALGRAALALLAYAIASSVLSRVTAILVAVASFALLVGSARDNAFEVLGQVGVWASLACGAHAFGARAPSRRRLWIAAGVCSALSLGFEPQCAIAAALAWLFTLGLAKLRGHGSRADVGDWALGTALGSIAVMLEIFACKSRLGAFAQSVLVDGFVLAGGPGRLLFAPARTVFLVDAYSSSLLALAITVLFARSLFAERPAALASSRREATTAWTASAVVAVTFGGALLLLGSRVRELPKFCVVIATALTALAGTGCLLGCAYAVWRARTRPEDGADEAPHLPSLLTFALAAALLRDPWLFGLRPFQGGDVLGAVSLIFLFLAAQRARHVLVAPLLLALTLGGLFGLKFDRALDATQRVRGGYWSNLYVNHRGVELLAAAQRARSLAGPDGAVLVVPEDPQIAGLIGQRRPPLRGSLIFSSQYPSRALAHDRAELLRQPPAVIVVHPRRSDQWQPWLAAFSPHPAATTLSLQVMSQLLPGRYRLDSSFRTTYSTDQGALDVYALVP